MRVVDSYSHLSTKLYERVRTVQMQLVQNHLHSSTSEIQAGQRPDRTYLYCIVRVVPIFRHEVVRF
jgi:hypothetical protein